MKTYILRDGTVQHIILNIGKSLLLIIGYTDGYYSQFGKEYLLSNKRITESLVLKNRNRTASYNSPKRCIRYRFFKLCTLPFNITYKWEGTDTIFKIYPEVWIRLNKVK